MIKNVYSKWEDLEKNLEGAESFVSEYFVSSQNPNKIYFGIEKSSKVIYLEFFHNEIMNYNTPNINGMDISIVSNDYINKEKLFLKIKNNLENEEIFISFSSTLTDALYESSSSYETLNIFEDIIKYYKDYFSNKNFQLSEKEEQGLCAELIELNDQIDKHGEHVVLNWLGPNKNKRDFVFDDYAIEIKSTKTQTNTSIHISNENQLDNTYPEGIKSLILKVFIMENNDNGFDVISCSKNILGKLSNTSIIKAFISKLLTLKINLEQYKPRAHFTLQAQNTYTINDKFPMLTSKNLPQGIHSIEYKITLDSIKEFKN